MRRRGTLALVLVCAALAAAARLPSVGWSLRPDESGFLMVARAWEPQPESPFGHYWVDRPPIWIALIRATDTLAGPFALRWLAMIGVVGFVLAAAGVALEVQRTGRGPIADPGRAVALTTMGATALVSNPSIDLVSAKGEILAVPVLTAGLWLVLRGVRRRSAWLLGAAGLLGSTALGLKQNLAAVLVFAVVLLGVGGVSGRLDRRVSLRLLAALVAGAAVPVLATLGWAVSAGVKLSAVWEAVYGFRADATAVIAAAPLWSPAAHALDLLGVAVTSFAALLLLWFAMSLKRLAHERPDVSIAAAVVITIDVVGLALGGSFWRPYLFALVPGAVLALALLTSSGDIAERRDIAERGSSVGASRHVRAFTHNRVRTTVVVAALVLGTVVSAVRWLVDFPGRDYQATAALLGRAIGDVSEPGDTLTIYGGRADLQLASGLHSPYPYLWSLPARARDPGSVELAALLRGPDAPTWFVIWTPTHTWVDGSAEAVAPALNERYERVGTACGGKPVHRLLTSDREQPVLSCTKLRARVQAASGFDSM